MKIIVIVALKQKEDHLALTVSSGVIVWKSSGNENNSNTECPPVVHYSDRSTGQLSVLFNYAGKFAVARLMDATSDAGYSDLCRLVIKLPLREVGSPIHHSGNEMKMNSISLPSTRTRRAAKLLPSQRGQQVRRMVQFIHLIYEIIVL